MVERRMIESRGWLHMGEGGFTRIAWWGAITIAFLLAAAVWAGTVQANSPINEFTLTPSSTQAGGHPDVETLLWTSNISNEPQEPADCECHDVKNITVDAPAGMIPNVYATPRCTAADFGQSNCPIDSQIGWVKVGVAGFGDTPGHYVFDTPLAVYNLIPHPGQPGLVGFIVSLLNNAPVFTEVDSRTEGDYGLQFTVENINHVFGGVSVVEQTFWGVPADPANDPFRQGPVGCTFAGVNGRPPCEGGASSNAPPRPFITAPTACGLEQEGHARVESYDHGFTAAATIFPGATGCDQLSFNPSLFALPTTESTDTASGIDIDLKVPDAESPVAPSPSYIKATSVTLPQGFSINAGAADGKTSCSAVEARVGIRHEAAQCPQSSKVGSLTIESTALPGPLPGYVYLADPQPGDRYRLWLIADGFGLHVKLPPGSAHADPVTGQLTVTFKDLPQFPFTDFRMHFFGSERGLLATPEKCGTYPVESTFTPWDSDLPEQTSTQFFALSQGPDGAPCPQSVRPFNPSARAGVSDRGAGLHSSFTLDLARSDGDQNLSRVDINTPPGFTAALKGIPYCPEAAIAGLKASMYSGLSELTSPACPSASQVGHVVTGAGAGTHPVYVAGTVYLAGPYKGAPISLITVIPALSGPYDLGNVVVRTALHVDEETAQVTAVSDAFPLILEGVPLRTRRVQLSLDRKDFALNPTNCSPLSVNTTVYGSEGASVDRRSAFQIANCQSLSYGPKLTMDFTGGVKRRGHPAIRAILRAKPGEANSRKISVTLPDGELLDNGHIGTVCTRVQFAAESCPEGSRIGHVTARTPLLDQPLSGAVYLRSSQHELPDMVLDLKGQVHVVLIGVIDTVKSRLRTTFGAIPDTPVDVVTLQLAGGKKGLVVNSTSLCGRAKRAVIKFAGQNGKTRKRRVKLGTACGKREGRHSRKFPRSARAVR
jgi:hypothetical protein